MLRASPALGTILVASLLAACTGGPTLAVDGESCGDVVCEAGWLCDGSVCRQVCTSSSTCTARLVCLDGLCRSNPHVDCVDLGPCPTAQLCVESDGQADAYCAAEACSGTGFSTCPEPPDYVCLDGGCAANPFPTCARLPACGIGMECRESDGLGTAACVPIACTGIGQGSCPTPAFECVSGLCERSRQSSGVTFAGGVAIDASSGSYRLQAVVSPPEGRINGNERFVTSPGYRLQLGVVP